MTLLTRTAVPSLAQFGTGLQAFEDAMSRMFNENYGNFAVRTLSPPVDIVENENELVLTADLPGVPMENIDIRIEDGTLAISGERRFEEKEEKAGYHRIERAYGSFKRCFTLPDSIDAEKRDCQAAFDQGCSARQVAASRTSAAG